MTHCGPGIHSISTVLSSKTAFWRGRAGPSITLMELTSTPSSQQGRCDVVAPGRPNACRIPIPKSFGRRFTGGKMDHVLEGKSCGDPDAAKSPLCARAHNQRNGLNVLDPLLEYGVSACLLQDGWGGGPSYSTSASRVFGLSLSPGL